MTMITFAPGFDARAYARACAHRLKAAGVDEAQAEARAEAVTEGVATKADLDKGLAEIKAEIKAELKAELRAELEAELKASVASLETRMIRFFFAVTVGQVALIVGLLKLFP